MKPVSMALVGLGGFGTQYVRWFREGEITPEQGALVAIVDPYAKHGEMYSWVVEQGIPVYDTLEEMYQAHQVPLVLISSPTDFHKPQILTALDHGSHVLCEKPLTALASDGIEIREYAKEKGLTVGVGFQWSFARTIQAIKKDIQSGKLGKPLLMKSFLAWPRKKSYYAESSWKGRVIGDDGVPVLDSVVANATAHYLHNIFFVLGEEFSQAALPETLQVELYRANAIDSFDTAIMTGEFANGAKLYYSASHAVDGEQLSPIFEYQFEKGTVFFNAQQEDDIIYATFADGTEKTYGDPFTLTEVSQKVRDMIEHVRTGEPVACVADTALPHLLVSNALFSFGEITNFPTELLVDTPEIVSVKGLSAQLQECYKNSQLPSEAGLRWSRPPVTITMEGYQGYQVD